MAPVVVKGLYFKNTSTLQRNRHLQPVNLCWSIWPCELSELCRPDVCISPLQTQCVIKCQGRLFANATDAVALGPPSGGPAPWRQCHGASGKLFIFARCNFHLRIQWKRHCQQRTFSSEQANFVPNVSKRAQFSC